MNFKLIESEEINIRESQGLVKDVYDPVVSVRHPLSEYRTMLDLIHRDPTLSAAYSLITKFSTYRGFDFTGGTKPHRDAKRKFFTELNFQQILPNILYSLNYYGDCFLELRRQDSKTINELHVLETTEMRIIYDEHGKVHGYVQRPFNLSNLNEKEILEKETEIVPDKEGGDGKKTRGVFFDVDEVIHFRMKWIGSQVYSYNPNEPISQIASTGLYAGNYLLNIFINMPPRYVAHLAGIGQADFKDAKLQFQAAKTNYKRTIAFSKSSDPQSKLDLKKIDAPYDETLLKVMSWINNEILKITHVPRTFVEGDTSENRGVGESLNLPFEVSLQWIHRCVIEPPINRNKFLMGLIKEGDSDTKVEKEDDKFRKKVQLRFNEISRKGENEILMNAGLLRDMGLKPEALITYLDERGILGIDPDDFDEDQFKKNMELNTSRERMNKGKQDMTQNRNEAGVSAASGKKMGLTA